MEQVLSVVDNREKALLVWIVVALFFALRSKGIRSSLVAIVRTLLSRPIVTVLAAMVGYVSFIVFASHQWGLWNFGLLKDTVVWFLGPALIMLLSLDQANKDPDYLKTTLLANLRLVLILEFVINFYVFSLYLELVLVPLFFVMGAMFAYSGAKTEYASVRRFMEFLLAAAGLSLLTYAVARIMGDVRFFATEDNLRLFLLPIVLTVLFLPFIYTLAIYSAYESIFVRITDNELACYTRRKILRACLFRLSRVNRFMSEYAVRLGTIKSRADAAGLIADFRGQQPAHE